MKIHVTFTDNEGIDSHEVAKYKEMGFTFYDQDGANVISDKDYELETLEEFHELIKKLGQCVVWAYKGDWSVEVYNDYRE